MAINNNYDPKTNKGTSTPKNYKRGNPIPLDSSAVWNSLASAQEYAKNDLTAYVGQIISVLDGEDVTAYIIKDEAGTLEAIGTGTGESVDLSEITEELEALNQKIEETHASVRDHSELEGGNRYGIYYEDKHLNIDSRNTVELTFSADTTDYEYTTCPEKWVRDSKTKKVVGSGAISEYPITNGTESWTAQAWNLKDNHIDYDAGAAQNKKAFLFKNPAFATSGCLDFSMQSNWRVDNGGASAIGTATYLNDYVVGNIKEIGIAHTNGTTVGSKYVPNGDYSGDSADGCFSADGCMVIGDQVVSFKRMTAGNGDDAFEYIKATVGYDDKAYTIDGATIADGPITRTGFYEGFVFYLVEPKYMGRMTSSSGGAPAGSSAWIYPITTDLSDESAFWTPTYCNNYVHKFIVYKDVANNKYYCIAAGRATDSIKVAPAKIINSTFKYGGQTYRKLSNSIKPVIVNSDRNELETKLDLYDMTMGSTNIATHSTPVLYPSVNTGKFFGTDPITHPYVIEEDLGAFSYNYTQQLNYVSDGGQLQIKRANPVGSYQIIKIEGQGRLYLDNGDVMVVPEALCSGTCNDLHGEIIDNSGQTTLYTQVIKVTRWKQVTREQLQNFENTHPGADIFKNYDKGATIASTGHTFASKYTSPAWQDGKTRIFYRTLEKRTGTITNGTIYDKNGIEFTASAVNAVKNWSALHELVTSENIGSYFAADIENFTLNIGTNEDGSPKTQTLGEFASGVELTINAAVENAVITMGDTYVTQGSFSDAVNDINLSMKGFDDKYAPAGNYAPAGDYATKSEVNNVTQTATDAATSAATSAATGAATQAVATAISERKLVTESDMQTYVTSQVVTPDLSGYVTDAELEEAIAGVTGSAPNMSSYYTKSEVDAKIDGIQIPGTPEIPDLTDYYTKSEVYNKSEIDEIVSSIQIPGTPETPDLTDYYNKSEINDIVSSIQSSGGTADEDTIKNYAEEVVSSYCEPFSSALSSMETSIEAVVSSVSMCYADMPSVASDAFSSMIETDLAEALSSNETISDIIKNHANEVVSSFCSDPFSEISSSLGTMSSQLEDLVASGGNNVAMSGDIPISKEYYDNYDYLVPGDSDDINNFISSNCIYHGSPDNYGGYFKFFIQVCGSYSSSFSGVFETDDVYLLPNTITTYAAIPAKVSFPPSIFTSADSIPSSINQGGNYYVTIKYDSASGKWRFYITSDSNGYGSSVISDLYDDSDSQYKYNKLVISTSSTPRPGF